MRSKAIFMALLALTFTAQAVPVTSGNAKAAARAWIARGQHLGVWFGKDVGNATSHQTANGATFYTVPVAGGGTVITSGDTEIEPIIAFAEETVDAEALDPKHPLRALLDRDLSMRKTVAPATSQVYGPLAFAADRDEAAEANKTKWAELIAEGAEPIPGLSFAPEKHPAISEPSDLRVDALMRTKWSQGDRIWNYYTPFSAVCGCVATAAAQVMRYLHGTPDVNGKGGLEIPFPVADVPQKESNCTYRNKPLDPPWKMKGGTYCWTNMPFASEKATGFDISDKIRTEEQKQNIGKLTLDIGLAVDMQYEGSEDGSGAVYSNVKTAMLGVFGYKQVSWVGTGSEMSETTEFKSDDGNGLAGRVLFANFDAGRPCMVGIPGHAIVADGYGYDDGLPYTHLNFGWGGSGDLWYNLPDMTTAGEKYTVVSEVGYNVFPEIGGVDEDGATTHGIISGRVLNEDGAFVANCAVTVENAETKEATELKTDGRGIWAAILPAGKYNVTAVSDDKEWIGTAENVTLEAPPKSPTVANTGNVWGEDLTLVRPSVRVGEKLFSSVDGAVEWVRGVRETNPGELGEPVVLEVLDTTWLKKTQTIDFACVIAATNADAYATAVTRVKDAALEVATNGYLAVSNLVFAGADKTVVTVASNGVAAVAGLVDFGVSYETAAIRTEAEDGFELVGAVERGFTLDCAVAKKADQICGIGRTTDEATFVAITNSASRIANYYDPNGELRARVVGGPDEYQLVWADQIVPVEEAVGFYIGADGTTNTAARLDKLIEGYEAALADGKLGQTRKLVIRKGGTLTRPLAVADGLELIGEGNPVIEVAGTAGFTVAGGTTRVAGVTFTNYVGNALFLVNGGALEIGAGTVFTDIQGTNKWSGAITVLKGGATIGGGATFDNCRADGKNRSGSAINSYGGAVYVEAGCTLALEGCTMTNCRARTLGAAVYACAGATVTAKGELWIVGNKCGTEKSLLKENDIDLRSGKTAADDAKFVIVGAVDGKVGVRRSATDSNAEGVAFATASKATFAHESEDVFFNTANDKLSAQAVDSPAGLRWTLTPTGPQPWEGDPSEASARVTYRDGTEKLYLLTYEALEALEGDATVAIVGANGNYIDADMEIKYNVTLKSDVEEVAVPYLFERRGNCSFKIGEGASLTIQDLYVRGCKMTNAVDEAGAAIADEWLPETGMETPVFDVAGGALTLKKPTDTYATEVYGAYGDGKRNASAVSVWKGGTFAMESGAVIRDCVNRYANEADGAGRGAAVLVDDGVAEFKGGTVKDCMAYNGSVFIGSRGKVRISGDTVIDNSFKLDGVTPNNLVVYDNGQVELTGAFDGCVGYTEGVSGDTKQFGVVNGSFPSAAAKVASAHNFRHDTDGDVGMVVRNGSEELLVWGSALAANGTYADEDGKTYSLVSGTPARAQDAVAPSLTYTGEEQTGLEDGIGYVVSGTTVATAAGTYRATITLRPGFAWSDGATSPARKTKDWAIAKAAYDMSGVTFDDATFAYNGKEHVLEISGELPEGVTVTYENNRLTEIGSVTARAKFTGDANNYEPIPDKTAALVVRAADEPRPPTGGGDDPTPPEPTPVVCKPFSITAIAQQADGSWLVTINPATKYCLYTLKASEDLSGWAQVGEPKECEADGDLSFEITSESAQKFWKVIGEDGVEPAN